MMTLDQLRDVLRDDMAAGAQAMEDDFALRMLSVVATSLLVVFFLPWQWVLTVAIAVALAELLEIVCIRISKTHFTLKLYGLWTISNMTSATSFCCLSMLLVAQSSPTAILLGMMILIGCLSQPIMVGVSSLALSYGCLMAPLAIGWVTTFYIAQDAEAGWALVVGLSILSLHLIMVTYQARSMLHARNEAKAAAAKTAAAKIRFMTAMSHEIRTPLNGIMGIAELYRTRAVSPEDKEQADILINTSESLKHLLDDILDHAKIEAGQMKLKYAPDDVRAVLQRAAALFQANAQNKNLELRCEFPPADQPLIISMDRLRMGQILSNLISNAIKFTDQGSIVLKANIQGVSKTKMTLDVVVCDTGRGMTEEEMSKLFQDFSQVDDQQSRAATGTGLGLAISRGLARAMKGDLTVTSTLGRGSEFRLSIPCTRAELPVAVPALITDQAPDLTGWRILAADDNATNRYIISKFLKDTQAIVTVVEGGVAALEAMKHQSHDILLLDIKMPDMDGPTVFDEMQNLPSHVMRPKVIALTANTHSDARRNYLRMGMNGYLAKPLKKSILLAELDRLGVNAPKPNPSKI